MTEKNDKKDRHVPMKYVSKLDAPYRRVNKNRNIVEFELKE